MALEPKEKYTDNKDEMQKKRRSFLKKSVYAAPSLIVLGQLARPNSAKAFGTPPSAPADSGEQQW